MSNRLYSGISLTVWKQIENEKRFFSIIPPLSSQYEIAVTLGVCKTEKLV